LGEYYEDDSAGLLMPSVIHSEFTVTCFYDCRLLSSLRGETVKQEKESRRWRPTNRQWLWAIGMAVALITIAISIYRLVKQYSLYGSLPGIFDEPPEWLSSPSIGPISVIALAALAVVVLLILGGARQGWTGFGGKSLWDWLQLLIVPLVLVTVGLWFGWSQDARQRVTEENRAMDTALQAYLDEMSRLLIEEDLHGAQPGDNLSDVARARTLTVLDQLDGARRGNVLQFLYEAELINKERPVVNLVDASLAEGSFFEEDFSGANLKGVDLGNSTLSYSTLDGTILSEAYMYKADLSEASLNDADLSNAHLNSADLSNASLDGTDLSNADLSSVDLSNASLVDTDLSDADLYQANLRNANLKGANLSNAFSWKADLSKANLEQANLSSVYIVDANLAGANLTDVQGITGQELAQDAASLGGATMPDGSKHPVEDDAPAGVGS
jgi:uncharacterized protein YjbI with pentapeptide repeats